MNSRPQGTSLQRDLQETPLSETEGLLEENSLLPVSARGLYDGPVLCNELLCLFPSRICLTVSCECCHIYFCQDAEMLQLFRHPSPFFLCLILEPCRTARAFFSGFGSPVLRLLLPGFPSSTLTAVGFGFLPLCATVLTSL